MANFKEVKAISILVQVVFVVTVILRLYDVFAPYGRTLLAAGSTNFWHIAGENYLRYGYFSLWFTPVINTGANLPPSFYINHPSLLAFYLSLFYLVFASSVLITKLAACIGWYGVSFLVFKLAALRSVRFACLAFIASLLLPFTNVFSNCADSIGGPLVVFLSLLYFYLLEQKASPWKIVLVCCLASFSEWSFIPLWITSLFVTRYSRYRLSLLITGICLTIFLVCAWLFGYFRIQHLLPGEQLGTQALIRFFQWLISPDSLISFKYLFQAVGNHISSSVGIGKWFSRVFITYILTLFTPLFFVGSFLILKKYKSLYLPLLIQPIAMILAFPSGAYKHAFWISTLVPFGSLALAAFFVTLRKKILVVVILVTLLSSTVYTVYAKQRDKTNTYFKIGTYLKNNTLPNQIVFVSLPKEAAGNMSELLLLGYYSRRDLKPINNTSVNNNNFFYYYLEKSYKCQIIDLKEL